MSDDPEYTYEIEGERGVLTLKGDWIVHTLGRVEQALASLDLGGVSSLETDLTNIGQLDTAGAFLIDRTASQSGLESSQTKGASQQATSLLEQARSLRPPPEQHGSRSEPHGFVDLLERTGRTVMNLANETIDTLAFLGETIVSMLKMFVRPTRMRWTAFVSVMEESGLDAVPIVAFLSFFVGMVIAFIGATTLEAFGATIFTVELVGIAVLREFGVVLTAVILAGRTNSAFTAQIGAMRMRQEVDAMTTLGLDPMDVLVVPRAYAMLIMTPVLTLVAVLFGIGGGAFVSWLALEINPTVFFGRLRDFVPIENFWVGMSKAPVFGMIVALIGCRQGLLVGGSVQSLGQSTTRSVVQALFSIIVVDALFAVFYMELGI